VASPPDPAAVWRKVEGRRACEPPLRPILPLVRAAAPVSRNYRDARIIRERSASVMVSACVQNFSARARKVANDAPRSSDSAFGGPPKPHSGGILSQVGRVALTASLFWTSYGLIWSPRCAEPVFMLAIDESASAM